MTPPVDARASDSHRQIKLSAVALGKEIAWLLTNTRPVAGEHAAALESWGNLLRQFELAPADIELVLERADREWRGL